MFTGVKVTTSLFGKWCSECCEQTQLHCNDCFRSGYCAESTHVTHEKTLGQNYIVNHIL